MSTFQQGIISSKPLAMGIAENGDAEKALSEGHESGKISLSYGFPSMFECPIPNGGSPIERKHINGLLYNATVNESRRQKGAITTYDTNLAEAKGGYSRGAILDWWDDEDGVLRSVISLKDSNKTDFRENGPDGVSWKVCSDDESWLPIYSSSVREIVASLDSVSLTTEYAYATRVYTMPFDGYVNCYTNLTTTVPISRVPYCTYCDEFAGVRDIANNDNWKVVQTGDAALSENVDLAAFTAFSECGHKLFMVIGDTLNGDGNISLGAGVQMNNEVAVNCTGCGVFLVSSSGLDGNAAQSMIPVKKGTKMQLFGIQTYTAEHITSYAQWNPTRNYVYLNGITLDPGGTFVDKKEYGSGTFHLSCVISAFPTKEAE